MRLRIQAIASMLLGIIILSSVGIGYMPIPQYMVELTCISNTCIGAILLLTSVKLLVGKKAFSNIVYQMWLVTILLVCIISIVGSFNFEGAFFFLHLINPLAFLVYYIVFIDEKKQYKKLLLTPIPAIIYLALDYGIGSLRGQFVYGIFEAGELSVIYAIIIGTILYLLLLLVGYITLILNLSEGLVIRGRQ